MRFFGASDARAHRRYDTHDFIVCIIIFYYLGVSVPKNSQRRRMGQRRKETSRSISNSHVFVLGNGAPIGRAEVHHRMVYCVISFEILRTMQNSKLIFYVLKKNSARLPQIRGHSVDGKLYFESMYESSNVW